MSKRHRRRASEIAGLKPTKPWFTITMIIFGLVVILFIRSTVSNDTAGLFTQIVGDPDLVLPKSVLDETKSVDAQPHGDTFRIDIKRAEKNTRRSSPIEGGRSAAGAE